MSGYERFLESFSTAVVSGHGARLAELFVESGTYDDYFFGAHS